MIDNIIEDTTTEANQPYECWNAAHSDQGLRGFIVLDRIEMKAFFGLHYLCGVPKLLWVKNLFS